MAVMNVQATSPYPHNLFGLDTDPHIQGRLLQPGTDGLTLADVLAELARRGVEPSDVTWRGGSMRWVELETASDVEARIAWVREHNGKAREQRLQQYLRLKAEFEEWQ